MGMFDFLFESEYDEQAPGMTREQIARVTSLLRDLGGMESEFKGVNSLKDVQGRFGISKFDAPGYRKQVKSVYDPQRKNLATARAKQMSRIASRMTGREGTPEFAYSPTEGDYAMSMGNLASSQAGAELEGFDKEIASNQFLANFFSNLLGQKESFARWKKGLQFQGEGQRGQAVGDYLGTLDDSSLFEDIAGIADTVTKFIPFAGPSSSGGGASMTQGLQGDIDRIRKRGYTL